MVTSLYERKILEWDEKLQTNKQTNFATIMETLKRDKAMELTPKTSCFRLDSTDESDNLCTLISDHF